MKKNPLFDITDAASREHFAEHARAAADEAIRQAAPGATIRPLDIWAGVLGALDVANDHVAQDDPQAPQGVIVADHQLDAARSLFIRVVMLKLIASGLTPFVMKSDEPAPKRSPGRPRREPIPEGRNPDAELIELRAWAKDHADAFNAAQLAIALGLGDGGASIRMSMTGKRPMSVKVLDGIAAQLQAKGFAPTWAPVTK